MKHFERSSADVAGGRLDPSGQQHEPTISVDSGSVDMRSTASSRIIFAAVNQERQRIEALMQAAARDHEAAIEAATLKVAAVREAAARDHEAAAVHEAAALKAEVFREAIARKEAAALETFITALMKHARMTRAEAEKVMRNEQ